MPVTLLCLQRFRSRSRSRSFTPPHWRREMERIVKGTEPAEPQAEDKWQKGDFLQQQERPSAKSRLGSRVESDRDAMPLQKRFEIELDEREEGYGFYTILSPSVGTNAQGTFCGAKHTSHIHSIIKHSITTANKHPGQKSCIDKNLENPTGIKLCISHNTATSLGPPLMFTFVRSPVYIYPLASIVTM